MALFDILFKQVGDQFDVELNTAQNDLETTDELYTALLLSIFCNKRADKDDALNGLYEHHGYWADTVFGFELGSKLYLLESRKLDDKTVLDARDYIIEATQWLLSDGWLKSIEVTTSNVNGILEMNITGVKDESTPFYYGFSLNWTTFEATV